MRSAASVAAACSLLVACAHERPAPTPSPILAAAPAPEILPAAPAASTVSAAAPAATCGHSPWLTYAHDAARTSASDGCLSTPLRRAWSVVPPPRAGREARIAHAIADADAVYAQGTIGKSPALWKIDAHTGEIAWAFDSRADIARSTWPTLAGGTVLMVDDGVYFVDAVRGKNRGHDLDAWGQSLVDGDRVVVSNTWETDGFGPYVASFHLDGRAIWKRDTIKPGRAFAPPDFGGVALGGDILVHAANRYPRGVHVSAFGAREGDPRWRFDVTPGSAPSVADARVFAIERRPDERPDRLVARTLSTGAVAWSREIAGARGAAPVQAGALVVVHTETGVTAFDRATGEPAWTAPLARTAPASQSVTTLAAAMGNAVLVVCSGPRLHVLRLADGTEAARFEPGSKSIDSPVVVGSSLYVAGDGAVVRIDSGAL